ncbi:MAG: hypothetical protein KKG73_08835 [Gammaproteobacteria bacterium]|nr:hypothetical protein [Gammaproteobacteria bacterium]
MTELCKYPSLIDWAINSHALEDTPTAASRKRALLEDINRALDTNYSEPHLNNWLRGSKPTPQRVWRYLTLMLIEAEVSFDHPALGSELVRLLELNETEAKGKT